MSQRTNKQITITGNSKGISVDELEKMVRESHISSRSPSSTSEAGSDTSVASSQNPAIAKGSFPDIKTKPALEAWLKQLESKYGRIDTIVVRNSGSRSNDNANWTLQQS